MQKLMCKTLGWNSGWHILCHVLIPYECYHQLFSFLTSSYKYFLQQLVQKLENPYCVSADSGDWVQTHQARGRGTPYQVCYFTKGWVAEMLEEVMRCRLSVDKDQLCVNLLVHFRKERQVWFYTNPNIVRPGCVSGSMIDAKGVEEE